MAKLSQSVTLKVTRAELAALRWNAANLGIRRYERRRPSAATVLRTMSLEEAVRRYREGKEVRTDAILTDQSTLVPASPGM